MVCVVLGLVMVVWVCSLIVSLGWCCFSLCCRKFWNRLWKCSIGMFLFSVLRKSWWW